MTDDPEITDPRDPYKRPDIVAEVDRWLALPASLREATVSHALLQAARDEIMALRAALDESIRLQSHYAALLNDYDGGERMRLNSDTWLSRLRALREKHDADR